MVLVDTNIVSFEFRNDSRLNLYRKHVLGLRQAVAFVTLAELYQWPLERKFSSKRTTDLELHLRQYVVLPIDDQLARRWAELRFAMKQSGKSISHEDAWIAATALRHEIPLVTHNRRHFEHVPGLMLISEG